MNTDPLKKLLDALGRFDVVDLSTDVTNHTDGPFRTRMKVIEAGRGGHVLADQVVPRLVPQLTGRLRAEDLPDNTFLRHETVTVSAHAGSHIDAPGHYGGPLGPGAYINDAPPETFIGPGVLVDCSGTSEVETCWDYLAWPSPPHLGGDPSGTVVLVRAGSKGAVPVAVVEKLLDRGIRVIGTDAASFDGSFEQILQAYLEAEDSSVLWPCHMLGRRRPYYQIEGLWNLERLPPCGFFVWAPPILIRGATAAWARVLALVPKM